ncbi:MAG TPA: EAL domain-containing protein [Methylophilaceae bacterium]|nr:EAL domain-containing protein [Methylophilaceae bacterium]
MRAPETINPEPTSLAKEISPRLFYQRSLTNRLFFGVVLTTLSALLIMGILMAMYDLRDYRDNAIKDMNMQAELIGRAAIPALQFGDTKLAQNNLSLLQVRPKIYSAALYDEEGRLFASYGEKDVPFPASIPAGNSISVGEDNITIFKPIIQNNEEVGTIFLQAEFLLKQRLLNYLGILLGVSSFALLVSLMFSYWLQRKIAKPILAISALAREVVERRDYSLRAVKTTDDEIGYMVDAFNSMLTEIEHQTKIQKEALKESELERERTLYISQHDLLTGLPNREMFNKELEEAINYAKLTDSTVHVLFIDVDRFKEVNDTLGHYVGDVLLAAVAKRLRSHIRKSDFVARLSGDEFGIICRNQQRIDELASTLVYELSRPFNLDDHEVSTSVSIGITSYPKDSAQSTQLLMNADMAMYSAKNSGRAAYQVYTNDLELASKRRHTIKAGLLAALTNNELEVFYQPVFSIEDNTLHSMEALIRWPDTMIPLLTPTELVDVAEDTGIIVRLGEWILRTACKDAREWQDFGYNLRVAINISSRQLRESSFLQLVQDVLDDNDLAPKYLDLEITERVLVENSAMNRDSIKELRDKGIYVSVDDFGTGFSSLSYLKHFKVNALKIDQIFVKGLPSDKEDVAITTAIISLAKGLGINVVAEGIETEEQLKFLRALNCNHGQGYVFSHALSQSELKDQLRSRRWNMPSSRTPQVHAI